MKILIITSALPPSGGAEQLAWELALSLSKNHKISVITFGDQNSFKVIDNIDVFLIKSVKHNLWYYMTIGRFKVLKIVKKINPDVINSHMHNIITFILRFQKAKKVLTLHNSKYEFYNITLSQKLKHKHITLKSIRKYTITTVSKHMQRYFTKNLRKIIYQIPNGIDSAKFFNNPQININNRIILYVGRLVEFKGVKKIIKASKELLDYQFVFIGDGPLLNYSNSENVKFLGKKKSYELSDYYNNAFISIFASEYENFPLVGLEAMACGSVVLASDIKGFQEYIINEENGFLSDLSSSDLIVKQIKKITSFPEIEKIRKNALETVEKLNMQKIAQMYIEIYKS